MHFTSCPVQPVLIRNLVAESQRVWGVMLGLYERILRREDPGLVFERDCYKL